MMIATRFVHAVLGLAPWAALWMLLVRWRAIPGPRPLLLFAAGNGLSVYTGVQPTGPTFATGLGLAAIFLFEGPGLFWPFASGLLLGGAFACRFQDAFFGPALLAAGLLRKRYREAAIMSLGAAIVVAIQGLIDLATWGSFLASPFRYVQWNVLEGAARRYGEEPFFYYGLFLLPLLVLVPPFVRSGARALATGARALPLPLGAAVLYLLLHSLVARKALRFVLPALILLLVVYAFDLLQHRSAETTQRRWHRRIFLGVHATVLVFVSVWYPHRGPIEAALALSERSDFADRLLIVDGDQDALGGHYYLRRSSLEVSVVKRRELHSWIAQERPKTPLYVLVSSEPLGPFRPPPPYELEPVGEFRNWPDLQRHGRRFLYRLRGS